MSLEVRFTVKGMNREIPFTVIQPEEEHLFLYSVHDGKEYKYNLVEHQGLLRLAGEENPFEEGEDIIYDRLTGLSSDWVEENANGIENTSFVDVNLEKPGYGPEQIFVENKPFSLQQLVTLIEDGDIELTPDFQRNFVWDKTRQSRLIESIFLGLPLPSIYLSQYLDGRLTVVDGLQRITTIKEFVDNKLTLTNLEYLDDCNNKNFDQLKKVLSPLRLRKFGQTQIMCFVIDYRSPNKLKFDLFRRLNTGGKPLNNQEIRNCLSRPHVQRTLREMVNLESFKQATSNSVKDNRMDAQEAALRFIYFKEQYRIERPIGEYNGDMESTLDDFIDKINGYKSEDLNYYVALYDRAMKNGYHLFGDYCFRKVLPTTVNKRRSPVNKLLMLTLSILLSEYDEYTVSSVPEESLIEPLAVLINGGFEDIVKSENLFQAITWSTNSKWNIDIAFSSLKPFLDRQIIFRT